MASPARRAGMAGASWPPRAALVRPPGASFGRALSEHPDRDTIDPDRAAAQHAGYRDALRRAGLDVVVLPVAEELPDACFVDDCAVVAGGDALLTRPGAPSRAAEPELLAADLGRLAGRVERMAPPATLDGGDVLALGDSLVVGRSRRTNQAGIDRLAAFAAGRGLRVAVAELPAGTLHLQSSVTALGARAVVGRPDVLDQPAFGPAEARVEVPPDEAPACNVVVAGGTIVMPAGCPRTAAALAALGFAVDELDLSEFAKADGGATCLSLLL
ncbi:MAG TPA: arginine deiminase family protein [Actinomycetota bacterium]|nr:arginine deiminase family protein [Actinomycetota bacterium]